MAKAANVKRFEGFEDMMIVNDLAAKYLYTHEEVMLLELGLVLNLLYLQKLEREFADEYERIQKNMDSATKPKK